jgi:hypothetical protein
MKFVRRTLLTLAGLLITGTGIFLLLALYHPIGALGYKLMRSYDETVLLFAGGALALIGLIPLLLGILPPKKQPETVLQYGDIGEVRITLNALENMVLRVVQRTKGVRGSSRRVLATPQGLTVTLGIRAAADENLPALTEELQKKIKEYLEGVTGIVVAEVRVKVEDIIIDQVPLKVK